MVITALLLLLLSQVPANSITVDGADLKARHAAALKLGAAKQGPFWAAYSFAVRPGIVLDVDFIGSSRSAMIVGETRNAGVFLLHEGASGNVTRAEIYRLDRPRDHAGYPVYWLGSIPSSDSLPFLRTLLNTTGSSEAAERLVDAMGAHDAPGLATTLRDVIRNVKTESARTSAISWLGHLPEQAEFLASLVRDERESIAVRGEAAEALGDSPDVAAVPAMQSLYRSVTPRQLKLELIEAIGDSSAEGPALSFLTELAERESVRELRLGAIEELGDLPPERAVPVLVRLYDTAQDEETKEEILEALGEANVEPAWQKLAAVAQRDTSVKLRKEAIELLGESDDPNATRFLEQLIR
jgi:hypothetical protein